MEVRPTHWTSFNYVVMIVFSPILRKKCASIMQRKLASFTYEIRVALSPL